MKWILVLSLVSSHAFASIWLPHEKEIWSLLRKAERTPEMQARYKYPGLEKVSSDRREECFTYNRDGITKVSSLENFSQNSVEDFKQSCFDLMVRDSL